jgi:hypothetical protein
MLRAEGYGKPYPYSGRGLSHSQGATDDPDKPRSLQICWPLSSLLATQGPSPVPRRLVKAPVAVHPGERALEFLHFGLTTKYQLTTALARLRGDREAPCAPEPASGAGAVGGGVVDGAQRKQPLTPGCAGPSPLGEGRYQLQSHVNPNAETRAASPLGRGLNSGLLTWAGRRKNFLDFPPVMRNN